MNMTRQIKETQDIRAAIVERAMPAGQAPGSDITAHDMSIERLNSPDETGCNWDAPFTFGPESLPSAITAVKALYNLPDEPAPAGRLVRSAIHGKPVQM
jgi:hypothetical protein